MAFMINRQAPQSGLANLLALRGRQGDTELVHMTKPEVAALQSMGQLTVNPSTGLPEAFKLKDILPTLAAVGVGVASGGTGFFAGPLGQALAAGGTSLAVNKGDLGKAAMDGLMAYGGAKLGQMLGGAQVPTSEAVQAEAAKQTAQATAQAGAPMTAGTVPFQPATTQQLTAQMTKPSLASQGLQAMGGPTATVTPSQLALAGQPVPGGQLTGAELAKATGARSALPLGLYASGAMDVPKPPAMPERKTPVVLEGRTEQKIGVSPEGGYSQEDIERAFIQDQYGTPIDPLKFFEYKSTPAVFGMARAGGQMEDATKYHGPGMASGMVRGSGSGDGMSDDLMFEVKGGGEIDKAALSEDEYIIDAYTVSALGNGSSDAGAKILDEFREEIRRKAYGKKKQPNQIDGRKIASSYA